MHKAAKSQTNALLFSLVLALIVEHRIFTDPMAINDDVRNQIYWMARFINPDYFANDYIASYMTQPSMISPVFSWIYHLGSLIVDPKLISQYLPFPIITLTTFFLFKLSETHAGPRYAYWICFTFNLYIWAMNYIAGGLPRSSFYLLFFAFLWLMTIKSRIWLPVCLALQALCYPTVCFMSMIILSTETLARRYNPKATLTALASAALVIYFRYFYHRNHSFGELINFSETIKLPECFIDGRRCVIMLPYSVTQLNTQPEIFLSLITKLAPYVLAGVIILSLCYLLINKLLLSKVKYQAQPSYLWTSTYVSLGLFILAHIILFYLYLPHRYISYTLPLISIFFIGTWFYQAEELYKNKPIIIKLLTVTALLLMATQVDDDLIRVKKQERQVLQYLSSTPIDSLIVAPTRFASNIPAFAYRSVLVSSETDIPFHKGYYEEIKRRLAAQERIYSSSDINEIKQITKQYGIDYIVLDKQQAYKAVSQLPEVFKTKNFTVLSNND